MLFVDKEIERSAITPDMAQLNYKYREGHSGYKEWLSETNKEDPRGHRYGNLSDGYMALYSLNYKYGNIELFQVKPVNPVFKLETKKPDLEYNYPEKGYLHISGTQLVALAKKVGLDSYLPKDKFGDISVENISYSNEQEKYTLAKNIGLFQHYKCKPIKYEAIPNKELNNIFPLISNEAFKKICENQNIDLTGCDYIHFSQKERWDFFSSYAHDIKITEGHKKATSLISHGYLAIASVSITTHSKKRKEGFKSSTLKDDFRLFFGNRENWKIEIIFDVDAKESTRENVNSQTLRLSKKLNKYGAVCLRSWTDYNCKGVDDYLAKYGSLTGTYKLLPSLNKNKSCLVERRLTADKTIDTHYLSTALITEARDADKKLLFIKSCQNTGKTTIVKNEMFAYDIDLKYDKDVIGCHGTYNDEKCLILNRIGDNVRIHLFERVVATIVEVPIEQVTIKHNGRYPTHLETMAFTHRQTLSMDLAKKLGLRHYQQRHFNGPGEVYCVDSILKETCVTGHYTHGFIDEASQVYWHLISSNTEIRKNRLAKIDRIAELGKSIINSNGLLVLTDADIDDNTVSFYCDLFGVNREECLVIENTYKPFSNRDLIRYKDCASWRQNLYDSLENKKRSIIHTSGQKHQSTHGSFNIEQDITERCEELGLKVIRLDAMTLADPSHEAYMMLSRLKDLKNYDVIIASSSLNTGVDLAENLVGKIDAVYGIYYGNYPLNDFEQSLERYRGDAPRHVFLPEISNNKINFGSTSADELYENIIGHTRVITAMYDLKEVKLANNIVSYYCNYAAVINAEYATLAQSFFKRAEAKGYKVQLGQELQPSERKAIKTRLKAVKQKSKDLYNQEVVAAPEISEMEAMQIESKLNRSYNETLKLTKHQLSKKYCLPTEEITTQVIEYDKEFNSMVHRYYLTANPEIVKIKDEKKLDYLLEQNKTLYPIDINETLKLPILEAYKKLMIIPLINKIKSLPHFSIRDIESYIETLKTHEELAEARLFIKQVLKIDLTKQTPATRLLSMILDRFGYSIKKGRSKREEGKVVRTYILESRLDEQFFSDLLTRWYDRDAKIYQEFMGDADISINY